MNKRYQNGEESNNMENKNQTFKTWEHSDQEGVDKQGDQQDGV